MNEEEWVELLREAHRAPIDPAYYAAVRARVLAELSRDRHRPSWVWAWGVAAAVVVAAVLMFPRTAPLKQASHPAGPADVAVVFGPPAPPPRATAIKATPAPGSRRRLEPVTIKLLTDDPNVIIYWFANGEGE
jgi:hypothetical protein